MKFELIRSLQNLEWYGKIPCLPINYNSTEGKRFVGEETDSWLMLEDFVSAIDVICPNDLDYGDVDYFDKEMCQLMQSWLNERTNNPMPEQFKLLYRILEEYAKEEIYMGTGVVIGL